MRRGKLIGGATLACAMTAAICLGPVAALGADTVAEDRPQLFVQANQAYEEGNYGEAAKLYEKLLEDGASGRLYYNLGNSYLRQGNLGQGIAAYLRSQALLPRNEDVRANLAFARKSTKDAVAPTGANPILDTLFFWHTSLSMSELWVCIIVFNFLFWVFLGWRRLKPLEPIRWATILSLICTGALGVSLGVRTVAPRRVAVVQQDLMRVYSGTATDTVVRFELHEGTEAKVVAQKDNWVRITLPDGKQGWVQSSDVEVVVL